VIHHMQPPYVGAKCCEPGCATLETCLWYKSKRAESLGEPWCDKCSKRFTAAAKKALKAGRCRLIVSNPCCTPICFQCLKLEYHKLLSKFAFNFNFRRYVME